MASTEQLKRVADLLDILEPLDEKQRGNRIEADDWNALVGVVKGVLEIDRVQEEAGPVRLEERFATKEHQHIGEVSVDWLDAELRSAVVAPSNAGIAGGILTLRARTDGLGTEVARLTAAVEQQQKTVDRFAVNDVARGGQVLRLEGRLGSIEPLRASVEGLTTEVGAVRQNVTQVLALRDSLLDPTGAQINVSQLKTDVAELQQIRQNMSGIDGSPLRMRDVELRLNELSDAVGTSGPGRLDARFATFATEFQTTFNTRLEEQLNATRAQFEASRAQDLTQVRAEFTSALATSASGFDTKLQSAITASQADTASKLETALHAQRELTRTESTQLVQTAFAQQSTRVDQAIASAVADAQATLETSLRTSLTQALEADLTARVDAIDGRLGSRLSSTTADLNRQLTETQTTLDASVASAVAAATSTLRSEVTTLVTQSRDEIAARLTDEVRSAFTQASPDFDARARAAVELQLATLDQRIGTAVTAATASLPASITAAVQTELAAADFTTRITQSVDAASADLRREFQAGLNQLQGRQTSAIDAAVTSLRGELTTAMAGVTTRVTEIDQRITTLNSSVTSGTVTSGTVITRPGIDIGTGRVNP